MKIDYFNIAVELVMQQKNASETTFEYYLVFADTSMNQ